MWVQKSKKTREEGTAGIRDLWEGLGQGLKAPRDFKRCCIEGNIPKKRTR